MIDRTRYGRLRTWLRWRFRQWARIRQLEGKQRQTALAAAYMDPGWLEEKSFAYWMRRDQREQMWLPAEERR